MPVESSRGENWAITAFPILLPLLEFARAIVVRTPGCAGTSMTAIEVERHRNILAPLPHIAPRGLYYRLSLLFSIGGESGIRTHGTR